MAKPRAQVLTLEGVIKNHIERVLWMTRYNQSQTARILGLPLSTLRSKIKKLGIETKRAPETMPTQLTVGSMPPSRRSVSQVSNLN
jgi:DNA-binding NtrC family response regulator